MKAMHIRDMDDDLSSRLRLRATRHGRSMEDEVKAILRSALVAEESNAKDSLLSAIRAKVIPLGGIDLELPARDSIRNPPEL